MSALEDAVRRAVDEILLEYGTSAGAKKGWKTRRRGKRGSRKRIGQVMRRMRGKRMEYGQPAIKVNYRTRRKASSPKVPVRFGGGNPSDYGFKRG